MFTKLKWPVFVAVSLVVCGFYRYEEHLAYQTGVYIGNAAFRASIGLNDRYQDAAMEKALAAANIIPSISHIQIVHSGFRDGWKTARAAAVNTQ